MSPFFFNIDVVGVCNLKCPTCPNGNMIGTKNSHGFMRPELLDQILRKATGECTVTGVGLFNWYEPLIHPQLPELVRIVNSRNLSCALSSNLNILKNPEALLAANPESLRISISGFNQANYGVTHAGGDVEVVKKNMRVLSAAKSSTGSKTKIHVLYHRYVGNLDDEILLRNYCAELGFSFDATWAYFMPLEKVLALADPDWTDVGITAEDRVLLQRIALPYDKLIQRAKATTNKACDLRDAQMSIDWEGRVMLCCSVYDFDKYNLGRYLDIDLALLQTRKNAHQMCGRCMRYGLHNISMYKVPEMDKLAQERISEHYGAVVSVAYARKTLFARLKRLIRKHGAPIVRHLPEFAKERLRRLVD